MSGPWDDYKAPESKGEAEGPWADFKPRDAKPINIENAEALPTPKYGVSEYLDDVGSALKEKLPNKGSLPAFLNEMGELMPGSAVAKNVGAHMDKALGNTATIDESLANQNAETATRRQEHPTATTLAGLADAAVNPLNRISGGAGIATSLATNAGDMTLRSNLANEKINSFHDTGSNLGNGLENLGVEGLLGLGFKGAEYLDTRKLDQLANNQIKKGFNATTNEMKEYGIKSTDMDDAATAMKSAGLYDKPIQSREGLYQSLRKRMTGLGESMDGIADEFGTGVARGDLSDQLKAEGLKARHIGQSGLQSAYNGKANAFLSDDVLNAEKNITKIDRALDKPKIDFDSYRAQQSSVGRKQNIQDLKQEMLNESDLRDDSLVRQLRQAQIDDQMASLDDRGNFLGAKKDLTDSQQSQLLESRANLKDVVDDGRDQILSTRDLREARKAEDARAFPSQFAVDPDKKQIAQTLRQAEMDSIPDAEAKGFYQKAKDEYATLAPAEQMTARGAARDEAKTLMGTIGRNTGAGLGAAAGAMVAGPAGAVIGATLGSAGQQVVSKYGNQLAAYGFHKASKVLQNEGWASVLAKAGERGGAAGVSGAHFLLMQRDPAYRQAHKDDETKK